MGAAFRDNLGGNHPDEEFTIVLLTYKREMVLQKTVQNLKGLENVNKIIVIINSDVNPYLDLGLPKIDLKIVIMDRSEENSLNSRFIPFSEIETESVLILDDDVNLTHDEITFAFRVWRENRHRLIGFDSRFHQTDKNKWRI